MTRALFPFLTTTVVALGLSSCNRSGEEWEGDGGHLDGSQEDDGAREADPGDGWPDSDDAGLDGSSNDGQAGLDGAPQADGDADGDGDQTPGPDADSDLPSSCGFDYESLFPASGPSPSPRSAVPPPWSAWRARPAPFDDWAEPDLVAHTEPLPGGYFSLTPKDPDDPDLVMPSYEDDMPLFERGGAWESETRCFETPAGVQVLTQAEAYDLYRRIAELTTGVAMDARPGVRSVVGLRGAYPGTFEWHGNLPNRFNDTLVLLWVDDEGLANVREFPVTTDVGDHNFGYHSSSFLRPNRRYRYVNGWHRGYNALQMDESGYRVRDDSNHNGHWDSDRNGWLPPHTSEDHDRAGGAHNIHMGSVDAPLGSAAVDVWSAGCQVIPGAASWTELIYRAWTGLGDPVDYFLIDVRDIDGAVFFPACEPDGSHECPIPIPSLPFSYTGDTSVSGASVFDTYSCSEADESGPELVFLLTVDHSDTLSVSVDCDDPVDIDVHLLDGDDPLACLERAHRAFDYSLSPGRYLIVADTFVDGSEILSGPFTLNVAF